MSVQKYVYLSMHKYFVNDGFVLKYSEIEYAKTRNDIRHRIIKQVLSDCDINGIDFNASADVPAGTGLGSSSAFTVGLLNLCNAYKGLHVSRGRLAAMACEVELEKLGEPIGKQDAYGCALGGVNFIKFHPDGAVSHEAIPIGLEQRRRLEDGLVMFYLGGTRSASALLETQSIKSVSDEQVISNLKAMTQQAHTLRRDICETVDVLGEYLHEGWERKRTLTRGISNPQIEEAYRRARAAGATGGKLLGAGGSGFLLTYAPSGARNEVIAALSEYSPHDVRVDSAGTSIIYSD